MNAVVNANGLITIPLHEVVGSFRTFGALGPLYEVTSIGSPSAGPAVMLRIRVIESGEELDYPLSDALADPRAR